MISSVVKHSAAQLLRGTAGGLSNKTCGEVTMARGHLNYKYPEFVRTMGELPSEEGDSLLT